MLPLAASEAVDKAQDSAFVDAIASRLHHADVAPQLGQLCGHLWVHLPTASVRGPLIRSL